MLIHSRLLFCIGAALLIGAALTAPFPVAAQNTVRDPAGVKQERDEVRRKLDALQKAIKETSGEKKQAAKALGLLENRLEQTQSRLNALDKDRDALEADINKLASEETQLQKDLENTQARLAMVMRNQYRRVEVNPTQAWLAGKSASQAARESYWYERISAAERDLAIQQATQARELQAIRLGLEKKQDRLDNTIAEQSKSRRELVAQREERNQLIEDLNSKLKNQELERKRLQRDETRLSSVITQLTRAIEEAKRRQALAEQQQKQQGKTAGGSKSPEKPEYTAPPPCPARGSSQN